MLLFLPISGRIQSTITIFFENHGKEGKGFAIALAQLREKFFTCFIDVDSNIIVITINFWYGGQGILMNC